MFMNEFEKHEYKVKLICHIDSTDNIDEHIHKDKLAQFIINKFRYNAACLDEYEEGADDVYTF